MERVWGGLWGKLKVLLWSQCVASKCEVKAGKAHKVKLTLHRLAFDTVRDLLSRSRPSACIAQAMVCACG